MWIKHPDGSQEFYGNYSVSKLSSLVDHLKADGMSFVQLSILNSDDEECDGDMKVYATDNPSSESCKQYPTLHSNSAVDIDSFYAE